MKEEIYTIEKQIKFIEKLSNSKTVKVNYKNILVNQTSIIKKLKSKGFELHINSLDVAELDCISNSKLQLTNRTTSYKSLINYYSGTKTSFTKTKGQRVTRIHLYNFHSSHLRTTTKYYYRLLIPLKKDLNFYYSFTFPHSKGLLEFSLNKFNFTLQEVSITNKKYLVFDCLEKISYDTFSDMTWAISVSLGYVLGHLVQEEGYYFAFTQKTRKEYNGFWYSEKRASIKSIYMPLYGNSFGWSNIPRSKQKFYHKKLNKLNMEQFSKLCWLNYSDENFRAIILLIIESSSRSLLVMPAGLSVALEGMADFFCKKVKQNLKLIKNKKIAQALFDDLIKVIDSYKVVDMIDSEKADFEEGLNVLRNKIISSNSKANVDKLQYPFISQGIILTETDVETIEYRNDFLHGNVNLNPKKDKRKKYEMDSYEIALRLYTLLNMIILKYIGFSGYILNHPKIQEHKKKSKMKEDYYRFI
jgi:hypothetical protein